MLSKKIYVGQKSSQYNHCQYWYIHWLQSGCQTSRHNGNGIISVLDDILFQDTGWRVNGPVINKIPICTQGQLTKINRTISEPPICQLLVSNSLRYILNALCRWRRICFWILDQNWKRDDHPLQPLRSFWPQHAHWHRKKSPWRLNAYSFHPQVSLTHEHYRSLTSPTPPWPSRIKKVRKRDAHMRTNNTKCRETAIIKVKGVFFTFAKHFKYLGSYIS